MSAFQSLYRARLAPLLALPLLALASCYGNDDHEHDGDYDDYPAGDVRCGETEQASIDAGEELDIEPAAGAGVFVEYSAGGTYRVTTSCDSSDYGPCAFDVLVTPLDGAGIESISPQGLESDDSVSIEAGSAHLVAYTDADLDGFTLQTSAGAAIELDALLDGVCGNHYLFWVGDGALHGGAPSNPINLVPAGE